MEKFLSGVTSISQKSYVISQLKTKISSSLLILCDQNELEEYYEDLSFFLPQVKITTFQGWERSVPSLEEVSDRSTALFHCLLLAPQIILASFKGLAQKTIPASTYMEYCICFQKGHDVSLDKVITQLQEMGYTHNSLVDSPGLYSSRGYIFDIYSPQENQPFRVEFFGEKIESIRFFDPETQKSSQEIESCYAIPPREIILNAHTKQTIKQKFKIHCDDRTISKKKRDEILLLIERGIFTHDIDHFLPFIYENPDSIFSYLPQDVVVFKDINLKYPYLSNISEELALDPQLFYLSEKKINNYLNTKASYQFKPFSEDKENEVLYHFSTHKVLVQKIRSQAAHKQDFIIPIIEDLKGWLNAGINIFAVVSSEDQKKRLQHILQSYNLSEAAHFKIMLGQLSEGFISKAENIIYLSETEVFGKKQQPKRPATSKRSFLLLQELKPNDLIVHEDHGIARFLGLKKLTLGDMVSDFLFLEFAREDKLYVPVHRMAIIQKYIGSGAGTAILDVLGTPKWKGKKKKASEDAEKLAQELIALYAKRHSQKGFTFSAPDTFFEEFESTFPYEETTDQLQCISDVLSDMASEKPMDRLVCGDVGFGKTEVAIRAAFKAVLDHKQVAILVPTTLLSEQHFKTFSQRFENFPVTVEVLSRFVPNLRQKTIIKKISGGEVDIIIGTHRLLSKDIHFRNLGLLVIDEEQKFGVKQKERIKQIKENIDILTLSATPIPRTLHMALASLRDLSLMTTPPENRRSIKTYISEFDGSLIRNSILREINRGGQVFFLHNRVQSIYKITEKLKALVPEVKFEFAHGQMHENTLENRMLDFVNKKFQVLVCTTIIGSGLDISSCNTIFINRADQLGLAELYQLRGRVGRSIEQAHCYLIIPPLSKLSETAKMRISAVEHHTALGSGFNIASQDLEIRGAGNLLGAKQSGNIHSIGLELYTKLLEQAVRKLQGEKVEEEFEPEINIKTKALIPSTYIKDSNLRLSLYRRMSLLADHELENFKQELKDRFGELPQEVIDLIKIVLLKNHLKKLKVSTLTMKNNILSLQFCENTLINPDKAIKLIQKEPHKYKVSPSQSMIIHLSSEDLDCVLEEIKNLLQRLA